MDSRKRHCRRGGARGRTLLAFRRSSSTATVSVTPAGAPLLPLAPPLLLLGRPAARGVATTAPCRRCAPGNPDGAKPRAAAVAGEKERMRGQRRARREFTRVSTPGAHPRQAERTATSRWRRMHQVQRPVRRQPGAGELGLPSSRCWNGGPSGGLSMSRATPADSLCRPSPNLPRCPSVQAFFPHPAFARTDNNHCTHAQRRTQTHNALEASLPNPPFRY